MRSQKQNNRPPRPYGRTSSSRSWSGGSFIPGSNQGQPKLSKGRTVQPPQKGEPDALPESPEGEKQDTDEAAGSI